MSKEESNKPILIYFNIRGHAQVIRSVLLEIGIEFEELIVSNAGYLDPSIIDQYGIEIQHLPYLVHDGNAMHEVFPILKYLCLYYKREDLLGKDLNDSIRISEILAKYMKEKNNVLAVLLLGLKEIEVKKMGVGALPKLADVLTEIMNKNKYCQATEKMFLRSEGFLCGYLTILDFIFYEKCFYHANMLTVNAKPKGEMTKKYLEFFESTDFYKKNIDYLESFKIFVQEHDEETKVLLDAMWVGDKKYLQTPPQ